MRGGGTPSSTCLAGLRARGRALNAVPCAAPSLSRSAPRALVQLGGLRFSYHVWAADNAAARSRGRPHGTACAPATSSGKGESTSRKVHPCARGDHPWGSTRRFPPRTSAFAHACLYDQLSGGRGAIVARGRALLSRSAPARLNVNDAQLPASHTQAPAVHTAHHTRPPCTPCAPQPPFFVLFGSILFR